MKIVCIGDSLTYGFGTSGNWAWPYIASQKLGISMINCGENGEMTSEMVCRFYEDVVMVQPQMCVIMGGSNDLLQGVAVSEVMENIDRMVHKAMDANILPIIAIPPTIDGEMCGQMWYCACGIEETLRRFETYRRMLIEYCAKDKLMFIDFMEEYPKKMHAAGYQQLYIDGTHPTKWGYMKMAEIFCEKMEDVIKSSE